MRSVHSISPVHRILTSGGVCLAVMTLWPFTCSRLHAQDQGTFESDSEGLESRALSPRTPRPEGSTLFETLSPDTTGVDFDGALPDVARYFRELTASGGYFGVATGDVDGDGLSDFFLMNPTGDNRLYRNLGDFHFADITKAAGLGEQAPWSSGTSFVDNDGRQDVLFTNGMIRDVQHSDLPNYATKTFGDGTREMAEFWSEQAPETEANLAFRNLGGLAFGNAVREWGLDHVGVGDRAATADFDNDDDLVFGLPGVGFKTFIRRER